MYSSYVLNNGKTSINNISLVENNVLCDEHVVNLMKETMIEIETESPKPESVHYTKSVNAVCTNRLRKEFREYWKLSNEAKNGIDYYPKNNNLLDQIGTISGPCLKDTPYEGGKFVIDIKVSTDYPYKPPKIKFITPIYHCNVDEKGTISLNILDKEWSPALSLFNVMQSIGWLFSNPNPESPLVEEIGKQYIEDIETYKCIAKIYTQEHAM